MVVDVDKIKGNFLSKIGDRYQKDTYFIDICHKFPDKYSLDDSIMDDQLRIFFEQNNIMDLCGETVKFCDEDSKRKVRLINISTGVNMPEVELTQNYIIESTWKKIEW